MSAWTSAAFLGDGVIDAESIASNLVGAVVKDPVQDPLALEECLEACRAVKSLPADKASGEFLALLGRLNVNSAFVTEFTAVLRQQ